MDILANFGQEKITDCLQVKIDQHLHDSESSSKDKDFFQYTFGDCIKDGDKEIPREVGLTDPEEFLFKERLDYILILDQGDVTNGESTSD
jgi:hypothetical protein